MINKLENKNDVFNINPIIPIHTQIIQTMIMHMYELDDIANQLGIDENNTLRQSILISLYLYGATHASKGSTTGILPSQYVRCEDGLGDAFGIHHRLRKTVTMEHAVAEIVEKLC